jgi:integrase
MSNTSPSQPKQADKWPRKITIGRVTVKVYKRLTPAGKVGFRVENYSGSKRRLDSYSDEADALDAANKLARQLSQRDVIGASLTREQSIEFASVVQSLQPLGLTLSAAIAAIVEAVKEVGDLPTVGAAIHFYKTKHTPIVEKSVSDIVTDLIAEKKARGKKERHIEGLTYRLGKFAEAFKCNISDVKDVDIQAWLDNRKTGARSYMHNRSAVNLLFNYAADRKRRYVRENIVAAVDKIDVEDKEPEVFTPDEAQKLMANVTEDFLPCLAINLFAGLRSAEIQRLTWENIDLKQGHIVVRAGVAKTASRRIVDIEKNLALWLAPYAECKGKLWLHGDNAYDKRLVATAKAAGIDWKQNAPRHSFISYALAICDNVTQVAACCGNSPAVIHKNYRKLVTKTDALNFFAIKPPKLISDSVPPMLEAATTN